MKLEQDGKEEPYTNVAPDIGKKETNAFRSGRTFEKKQNSVFTVFIQCAFHKKQELIYGLYLRATKSFQKKTLNFDKKCFARAFGYYEFHSYYRLTAHQCHLLQRKKMPD